MQNQLILSQIALASAGLLLGPRVLVAGALNRLTPTAFSQFRRHHGLRALGFASLLTVANALAVYALSAGGNYVAYSRALWVLALAGLAYETLLHTVEWARAQSRLLMCRLMQHRWRWFKR